jgi:neutral ceramidase
MQPGGIPADPFGRTTDQVLMNPGVGNAKVVKPAGPIDPDVCILAVTAGDGKPLCALGSYALHYVGAPGATISADYFAVWSEEMRRRLNAGPEFVGILANACSGNINNVDVRGPAQKYPPFAKMREVASALAEESMRVWNGISFKESVELDGTLEELDLAVRKPTRQEVEAAKKALPGDTTNVSERSHIYAKETVQLAEYPDRVKAPVQAMRIGDLGIATFPGEAFVELGIEVKKRSPFQPTFIIELANSYLGYIPTVEGHQVGGYETWRAKSSFLERDAAPKMVDSVVGQLQRLKRH